MSIHAHIKELRTRLFVLAAVFLVASSVAYVFREDIAQLLMAPLNGQKLYNLTPGGQFSFILKIIMWSGLAATIPFFVASLYSFIAPALPKKAQRHAPMVLFFSIVLLCAGAVFGYIYAIPGAMRFLLSFADGLVTPMITGESYLNFVLAYTVGLGVLFQIPLIMIIANWVTPLKPKTLLNMERYVIVVAFVAAAIITPTPDPTNQTIIAAPVIAMYQIGFAAVLVSHAGARRRMRAVQKAEKQQTTQHQSASATSASPLLATFTDLDTAQSSPSTVIPEKLRVAATPPKKLVGDIGPAVSSARVRPARTSVAPAVVPSRPTRVVAPSRPSGRPGQYLDGVSMSYRPSSRANA